MAKTPKDSPVMGNGEVKRAKPGEVTKTSYIRSDGTEVDHPQDADGFRISVVGGDTFDVYPDDLPENIQRALKVAAGAIVLKNAVGSAPRSPAERSEAIGDRLDSWNEGRWYAGGGGGPRVQSLAEAIVALGFNNGKSVEEVAARLREDEELRAGVSSNAQVKAEVAEAAARRARERAEAAGGAETSFAF